MHTEEELEEGIVLRSIMYTVDEMLGDTFTELNSGGFVSKSFEM